MSSAESASTGSTIADRVLGFVGGGMVLLAVILLIRGCVAPDPEVDSTPVPAIRLVQAVQRASGEDLVVDFRTDAQLRQGPTGWEADSLHLHADVGGRMVMSDMGRVELLEKGSYRWLIPPAALPPGEQPLVLYWAGPSHRRIATGATPPVTIRAQRP